MCRGLLELTLGLPIYDLTNGHTSSGTIEVVHANFSRHEFDNLRFDIALNDLVYHLRADSKENREKWMEAFTDTKVRLPYLHLI